MGVFSGEMGTIIVLCPIAALTNYSKISGFHTHTKISTKSCVLCKKKKTNLQVWHWLGIGRQHELKGSEERVYRGWKCGEKIVIGGLKKGDPW